MDQDKKKKSSKNHKERQIEKEEKEKDENGSTGVIKEEDDLLKRNLLDLVEDKKETDLSLENIQEKNNKNEMKLQEVQTEKKEVSLNKSDKNEKTTKNDITKKEGKTDRKKEKMGKSKPSTITSKETVENNLNKNNNSKREMKYNSVRTFMKSKVSSTKEVSKDNKKLNKQTFLYDLFTKNRDGFWFTRHHRSKTISMHNGLKSESKIQSHKINSMKQKEEKNITKEKDVKEKRSKGMFTRRTKNIDPEENINENKPLIKLEKVNNSFAKVAIRKRISLKKKSTELVLSSKHSSGNLSEFEAIGITTKKKYKMKEQVDEPKKNKFIRPKKKERIHKLSTRDESKSINNNKEDLNNIKIGNGNNDIKLEELKEPIEEEKIKTAIKKDIETVEKERKEEKKIIKKKKNEKKEEKERDEKKEKEKEEEEMKNELVEKDANREMNNKRIYIDEDDMYIDMNKDSNEDSINNDTQSNRLTEDLADKTCQIDEILDSTNTPYCSNELSVHQSIPYESGNLVDSNLKNDTLHNESTDTLNNREIEKDEETEVTQEKIDLSKFLITSVTQKDLIQPKPFVKKKRNNKTRDNSKTKFRMYISRFRTFLLLKKKKKKKWKSTSLQKKNKTAKRNLKLKVPLKERNLVFTLKQYRNRKNRNIKYFNKELQGDKVPSIPLICSVNKDSNTENEMISLENATLVDVLKPYVSREACEYLLGSQRKEDRGKKTIVLDLDETLVHSTFTFENYVSFELNVNFENKNYTIYVKKRPGADFFLEEISKFYEIVIFTASLPEYANLVINILDKRNVCSYRLFRDSCTLWQNNYVKDMKRLGRDLNNVIILDNSIPVQKFNEENCILIESWFDDPNDRELYKLIPYLKKIANKRSVIPALKKYNEERIKEASYLYYHNKIL